MWDAWCADCGRWELIGARGTIGIVNVEPGLMVVFLRCSRGHTVQIATGRAVHGTVGGEGSLRLVG